MNKRIKKKKAKMSGFHLGDHVYTSEYIDYLTRRGVLRYYLIPRWKEAFKVDVKRVAHFDHAFIQHRLDSRAHRVVVEIIIEAFWSRAEIVLEHAALHRLAGGQLVWDIPAAVLGEYLIRHENHGADKGKHEYFQFHRSDSFVKL